MRIWVTRAQPQAAATAERLKAMGHEPVVLPVIETRPLAFSIEDFADACALAVTSQAAIAAIDPLVPKLCAMPVYAVGDATATAARDAGFETVYSAAGKVGDLVALILASPSPGLILHASAREPAGDLVGALNQAGRPARRLAIYETLPLKLGQIPDTIDGLMVHSAQAAKVIAASILPHQAHRLTLYGLSTEAVLPLVQFKFAKIALAPFANEQAILNLLA
jgi:uroporphyrinogen-III synthase